MRRIDHAVKKPRAVHPVLDNDATHKTPDAGARPDEHPLRKRHFTPTSASRVNMVDRVRAKITTRRNRCAGSTGVNDLKTAIHNFQLL